MPVHNDISGHSQFVHLTGAECGIAGTHKSIRTCFLIAPDAVFVPNAVRTKSAPISGTAILTGLSALVIGYCLSH